MINKAIYYILSNDDPVTALVVDRIFAVTAPEDTVVPLIVFSRESVDPIYTKSGHEGDRSSVIILIFSKIYDESIEILKAVRKALEFVKGEFNGVSIYGARVTGIDEGYDLEADTYYQTLLIQFLNK